MRKILIHVAGGIGNIIMVTPAIKTLAKAGHHIELLIEGDYEDIIELFRDWKLLAKVSDNREEFKDNSYDVYLMNWLVSKPIEIKKYENTQIYHATYSYDYANIVPEYSIYLEYVQMIDASCEIEKSTYCGASQRKFPEISKRTVVLYSGCKKEYPMKRWDKFNELAKQFEDVAVIGTGEDSDLENSRSYPSWIRRILGKRLEYNGKAKNIANCFGTLYNHRQQFGSRVKNYIGQLSLGDTASLIAQAGLFIGNDGGLSHISVALGIETYVIFGPSDHRKAELPLKNMHIIKKKLDCQPCQFGGKFKKAWQYNYVGCPIEMKCMREINCEDVLKSIKTPEFAL